MSTRGRTSLIAAILLVSAASYAQEFESSAQPLKIQFGDAAPSDRAGHRNYALLIGVNDYQDADVEPLSQPIKDAKLLRDVLTKKYTFEEEDITLLENPTFETLHVAFEELFSKVTKEDMLLIFYAGHGEFDKKSNIGYWLPADARKANTAKWFRNSTLVENIGAINSKHTFLIADACFAGGIFKTRSITNNANADVFEQLRRQSRKALTSGSMTTVPDESVFMKYLLKSLDENQLMYYSTEELYDNVRLSMRNNATTRPAYGEIQNAGDEGGCFVLIRRKEDPPQKN
jgi:hypothetical protein